MRFNYSALLRTDCAVTYHVTVVLSNMAIFTACTRWVQPIVLFCKIDSLLYTRYTALATDGERLQSQTKRFPTTMK